jgi:hypothetical protein
MKLNRNPIKRLEKADQGGRLNSRANFALDFVLFSFYENRLPSGEANDERTFAEMRRLYERGANARGLVVDAEGVMLGPNCALVERTSDGYRRINAAALDKLVKTAFGDDHPLRRFSLVLDRITAALAAGDLVKAQLLGLEIPLRTLDDRQLTRLQSASTLIKDGFDPNQPRDERGRWTSGTGETSAASDAAPDRPEPNASIAQLWLTSLRGSPDLRGDAASANFNEAGYPGDYHDFLRDHFAEITKGAGGQAITEVPLTGINGVTTRADLLVKPPGAPMPFIIEIKTGDSPQYTAGQRQVYPLTLIGGHATSFDLRVAEFGLVPGTPFPPLRILEVYTRGPGSEMFYKWLSPAFEKLLVAIFTRGAQK